MIIYANPSSSPKRKAAAPKTRKKPKRASKPASKAATKGASPMKKRRSAAQKAATRKMLAANRARKRHKNPSSPRRAKSRRRYSAPAARHTRRRRHRNPSFGGGSFLGELMSKDGLIMIASGVAGASIPVIAQLKFLPSLTGYTKTAARAAIGVAGAWALNKWVSRKAATAFAVTALASAVAEVVNTIQSNAVVQPMTAQQQAISDAFAENPVLMDSLQGTTSSAWKPLSDGYAETLNDGWSPLNDGYSMTLNDYTTGNAFSNPFN